MVNSFNNKVLITDLPSELLMHVCKFLPKSELESLVLVNKQFSGVVKDYAAHDCRRRILALMNDICKSPVFFRLQDSSLDYHVQTASAILDLSGRVISSDMLNLDSFKEIEKSLSQFEQLFANCFSRLPSQDIQFIQSETRALTTRYGFTQVFPLALLVNQYLSDQRRFSQHENREVRDRMLQGCLSRHIQVFIQLGYLDLAHLFAKRMLRTDLYEKAVMQIFSVYVQRKKYAKAMRFFQKINFSERYSQDLKETAEALLNQGEARLACKAAWLIPNPNIRDQILEQLVDFKLNAGLTSQAVRIVSRLKIISRQKELFDRIAQSYVSSVETQAAFIFASSLKCGVARSSFYSAILDSYLDRGEIQNAIDFMKQLNNDRETQVMACHRIASVLVKEKNLDQAFDLMRDFSAESKSLLIDDIFVALSEGFLERDNEGMALQSATWILNPKLRREVCFKVFSHQMRKRDFIAAVSVAHEAEQFSRPEVVWIGSLAEKDELYYAMCQALISENQLDDACSLSEKITNGRKQSIILSHIVHQLVNLGRTEAAQSIANMIKDSVEKEFISRELILNYCKSN